MSQVEEIMKKRLKEAAASYETMWDEGRGSHHPDFDPEVIPAPEDGYGKASRPTEELYNAIVKNDVAKVYCLIDDGADVNFVFGPVYRCAEGYTPLMVASHRGRLECAKALLRAGADPNFVNAAGDLTLFWALDGGVEMTRLLIDYGADTNAMSPKGWSPLTYAQAKGKYGPTEEKGIYPEDVLLFYGAKVYGSGPPVLGTRSPRNSYNPQATDFMRERGSYQSPFAEP